MANFIVKNRFPSQNLRNYSTLDEFENLVNRFFNNTGLNDNYTTEYNVPIELLERDNDLILKASLPGLKKEDIEIEVSEESIILSGEYKSEINDNKDLIYRSEFFEGSFKRLISLPQKINHQKTKAEYKDGILTLIMPKLEEESKKTLKISL